MVVDVIAAKGCFFQDNASALLEVGKVRLHFGGLGKEGSGRESV